MNEPVEQSPDADRKQGYELRDVNVWYVMAFAAALGLMVVGVLPLMDWTFARLEQSAESRDVPLSPLANGQEPPPPRLQSKPSASLEAFRRREQKELTSYRWIDKQQGVVQIPVDRAMQLLLDRGLPEPEAPKEPAQGETAPDAEGKPADKKEAQR